MPGEIEHVLGHFDVHDFVEIFLLVAHFVRIAKKRADEPLIHGFESDDVLAVRRAESEGKLHVDDGNRAADGAPSVAVVADG